MNKVQYIAQNKFINEKHKNIIIDNINMFKKHVASSVLKNNPDNIIINKLEKLLEDNKEYADYFSTNKNISKNMEKYIVNRNKKYSIENLIKNEYSSKDIHIYIFNKHIDDYLIYKFYLSQPYSRENNQECYKQSYDFVTTLSYYSKYKEVHLLCLKNNICLNLNKHIDEEIQNKLFIKYINDNNYKDIFYLSRNINITENIQLKILDLNIYYITISLLLNKNVSNKIKNKFINCFNISEIDISKNFIALDDMYFGEL